MKKKYSIVLLLTLTILAQATVEDREAPPIVENISEGVIEMPEIKTDAISQMDGSDLSGKTQTEIDDDTYNSVEMYNGIIRKIPNKSSTDTSITMDEDAPEIENLESSAIDSL